MTDVVAVSSAASNPQTEKERQQATANLSNILEFEYRKLCCDLVRQFYSLGWVSGTGGGMTIKNLESNRIVMAPSSVDKERLQPHNIFVLNAKGEVIENGYMLDADSPGWQQYKKSKQLKMTQCFTLFMAAYDLRNAGAVIHNHSKHASMISMMFEDTFRVSGLEMIKGITGHENIDECVLPIIQNTPQECQLTKRLRKAIKAYPRSYGVIVRGHGIYVWGDSWQKAKGHAECYDYLFEIVIEMRKLQIGQDLLYTSKYYNRYPVTVGGNTKSESTSVDDSKSNSREIDNYIDRKNEELMRKKMELFSVYDHPFIIDSNNNNNNDSQTETAEADNTPTNTDTKVPMLRSLVWNSETSAVTLVDQRRIPQTFDTLQCQTYTEIANAIKTMAIRGAPAIGAAGAYGMLLAAIQVLITKPNNDAVTLGDFQQFMTNAKTALDDSRPTAVNLVWATSRLSKVIESCCKLLSGQAQAQEEQQQIVISKEQSLAMVDILTEECNTIAVDDIDVCARIGTNGGLIVEPNYRIMHHCNTGSLATVCGGTALSVIFKAFYDEKNIFVYVNETRPRLQGSRLTSWELSRMGIPHNIVVDSCAAHLLSSRKVDMIVVGCDRVAMNGDTANKIGTHSISVIAYEYGVPVYIACPVSTIDPLCESGDSIVIEERNPNEILKVGSVLVANPDGQCYNPAFDVTPHKFITAFITEYGLCYPPFTKTLADVVGRQKTELNIDRQVIIDKYKQTLVGNQGGNENDNRNDSNPDPDMIEVD